MLIIDNECLNSIFGRGADFNEALGLSFLDALKHIDSPRNAAEGYGDITIKIQATVIARMS